MNSAALATIGLGIAIAGLTPTAYPPIDPGRVECAAFRPTNYALCYQTANELHQLFALVLDQLETGDTATALQETLPTTPQMFPDGTVVYGHAGFESIAARWVGSTDFTFGPVEASFRYRPLDATPSSRTARSLHGPRSRARKHPGDVQRANGALLPQSRNAAGMGTSVRAARVHAARYAPATEPFSGDAGEALRSRCSTGRATGRRHLRFSATTHASVFRSPAASRSSITSTSSGEMMSGGDIQMASPTGRMSRPSARHASRK